MERGDALEDISERYTWKHQDRAAQRTDLATTSKD